MDDSEALTKVHIDLPNHWAAGGESIWAHPLGEDLYELRNVPFYAYDLNYLDVVRATSDGPALKPEVREVVRRSGHRTLRVVFEKEVPEERRLELLDGLARLRVSYEGATRIYFALDLEPGADEAAVREQLDASEQEGLLAYETCEPRRPGSFDDAPKTGG